MAPPHATAADRSSDAFTRLLSRSEPEPVLVGVEHEFEVLDPTGVSVDFRDLLHELAVPGRRIDPGDDNAYRLAWGGAFTADGAEAEMATPPIPVGAGFESRCAELAHHGTDELVRLLPGHLSLRGYSTHISVSAPDAHLGRIAAVYASSFAIPLLLLTAGPSTPGILIRPRVGRLELCLDHVVPDALAAVVLFCVGSVQAAVRAVLARDVSGLPPAVALSLAPAVDRFGWYVGRDAVGTDLYRRGRAHDLTLAEGGVLSAGDHLALAVDTALANTEGGSVRGSGLWSMSASCGPPARRAAAMMMTGAATPAMADGAGSPFGDLLRPRERPGLRVEAVLSTWDLSVFRMTRAGSRAYACIPRGSLARFLTLLDNGDLDRPIRRYLDAANGARPLLEAGQTAEPGLFDVVGPARNLLPQEPGLGFTGGGPRRGKRRRQRDHDRPEPESSSAEAHPSADAGKMASRTKAILAAAAAVVIAIAAIAFASSGGGDPSTQGQASGGLTSSGPTTDPTTSPTAAEPLPLGEAHVDGTFKMLGSPGVLPRTLSFSSSCEEGPCGAEVKSTTSEYATSLNFTMRNAGGAYAGAGKADLRCPPPPDPPPTVPWPLSVSYRLRVTEAKMIDGVWTATELSGAVGLDAPKVTTLSNGTRHNCSAAHFNNQKTFRLVN